MTALKFLTLTTGPSQITSVAYFPSLLIWVTFFCFFACLILLLKTSHIMQYIVATLYIDSLPSLFGLIFILFCICLFICLVMCLDYFSEIFFLNSVMPLMSLLRGYSLGHAQSPWDDRGFSRILFDYIFP